MAMLDVRGVTKRFGGLPALVNFDLQVGPNEIVALVGPNGAGKSTALACIAGLVQPTHCDALTLDGVDLRRRRPDEIRRAGVAMVTQRPRVFASMDVRDDVAVGMLPDHNLADARQGATAILAMLAELSDAVPSADKAVGNLTLRERRLVALARALAIAPKVLLLDEPMAGLAPGEVDDQAGLIEAVARSSSSAIVLVEHVLGAVHRLATTVVVIDHGHTIASASPAEVFADAAVQRAYLGPGQVTPGAAMRPDGQGTDPQDTDRQDTDWQSLDLQRTDQQNPARQVDES